jgi:outer membrane protein
MPPRAWTLGLAAGALLAGPLHATTLRDAFARAYTGNPTLTAERARLRGTDEGVPLARAEGLPQISATANFTHQMGTSLLTGGTGSVVTVGPSVTMPLFAGGRIRNGIRAADERVTAGRADLRTVEGNVFSDVVGGYMDVLRDEAIVSLNEGNVKVLETNLQASKDRFAVGDLTRTDVAQSEARLAVAHSDLAAAQGKLTASRENYRRLVGVFPDSLDQPPSLPSLPATADDSVDVAIANNPALASIAAQRKAASYDVGVARAGRLPQISAVAGSTYSNYLGTANRIVELPNSIKIDNSYLASTVGVQATIPLYQGGAVGARVRQAQAAESEAIEQSVEVERQVVANARSAFAAYVAANETIASSQSAVSANRLALEGVRAENSVGTRDVLDVLNAEQELLNSEVTLVTAQHDAYVAGFALLNAMGEVNGSTLGLDGGTLYDPTINYRHSRSSFSDWSDGPEPKAQATRTGNDTSNATTPPAREPEAVAAPGATSSVTPPAK